MRRKNKIDYGTLSYRQSAAKFRKFLYKCESVDKEELDQLMATWWPTIQMAHERHGVHASEVMTTLRNAYPKEYKAWLTLNLLKGGGIR